MPSKKRDPNWRKLAIELYNQQGMTGAEISRKLGVPSSTLNDFLRKLRVEATTSVTEEIDNSRILLISDLHIPYHHQDSLKFLTHLKQKYKPTRVICLGDELDKHSLSYHESDPDLPSAGDELRAALPVIAELYEMFPEMDILESNHGSLVWRKAKTHGIPRHYIKAYQDVLGVTDSWKWHFDLNIELPDGKKCYFHHGKSSDVTKLSQQMGMCAVQGHYHEKFKIKYWGNPSGLYWGLQIGCLIDDESYAFSYNNVNIKRPVIGTGLIINSIPVLEPMIIKNGRWCEAGDFFAVIGVTEFETK